jgi:hypothetical protein
MANEPFRSSVVRCGFRRVLMAETEWSDEWKWPDQSGSGGVLDEWMCGGAGMLPVCGIGHSFAVVLGTAGVWRIARGLGFVL